MINGQLINIKECNTIIDSIICPHCLSEMTRNKMEDPDMIYNRSYICPVCGAEEFADLYINGKV